MKKLLIALFILCGCSSTDSPQYYPKMEQSIRGTVLSVHINDEQRGYLHVAYEEDNEKSLINVGVNQRTSLFVDSGAMTRVTINDIREGDMIVAYPEGTRSASYPPGVSAVEIVVVR